MKIITKLLTLGIISVYMLCGCGKGNNDLTPTSVPIDSQSEETTIVSDLVSKADFQKISQDYQTEYVRYESPYHGLYDENIKFPDNEYTKDYPINNYNNIVTRYVMQKYPDADVSNISHDTADTGGNGLVYYNYLDGNKYIYNYGVAYVYTVGSIDDRFCSPYDDVVLYDPVNDTIMDLYTDEISQRFSCEIDKMLQNDVFLSGFGQGRIQGKPLLEMLPTLYKDMESSRKVSAYLKTNNISMKSGNNINMVDSNTDFECILNLICALSSDSENKAGDYYVDGGAAFYLIVDYKNHEDPQLKHLKNINPPVLSETVTKYVSLAETKQIDTIVKYVLSPEEVVELPIFIYAPNTTQYEFIYNTKPNIGLQ